MKHKTASAIAIVVLFVVILVFRGSAVPAKTMEPWQVGYWIWAGEPAVAAAEVPDVLYLQVQGRRWPNTVPVARNYFVVRRIEPQIALSDELAASLVDGYRAISLDAGDRARLSGMQIDYDCPTAKLESYGRFLTRIRDRLPEGSRLSITALLDWFGPGTAIRSALSGVDEFVPQFYDVGTARLSSGIAATIDAARWSPIFDALKTPYRIGISSFGRIARVRRDTLGKSSVLYFRDASPFQFAGRRQLKRSVESTAAGETVVRYEVVAPLPEREDLAPGDVVEITFPTDASIRAAFESVRSFGGYCAGAIFFRWPNRSETLALSPDDVSRILRGEPEKATSLETRDGGCLERACADLYLHLRHHVDANEQILDIRASGPIDIFLPDGPLRSVFATGSQIHLRVPAFSGLQDLYVGRAISSKPTEFQVDNR